jgi:acyl-CoA thioester hydrolase
VSQDRPEPFTHTERVRYLESDQQGVVFNMWYLAYMDEAMTAFLAGGGLSYTEMLAAGYDFQMVHTELDWTDSLRFGDVASIDTGLAAIGRSSFTLQFRIRAGDRPVARTSTVYVTVRTDGSGKCEVPELVRRVLGAPHPLWDGQSSASS